MRGLLSILSFFCSEFNIFNKTGARRLDSIYHMSLEILKIHTGPRSAVGIVPGYRCVSDADPVIVSSIPAGPILSWRLILL